MLHKINMGNCDRFLHPSKLTFSIRLFHLRLPLVLLSLFPRLTNKAKFDACRQEICWRSIQASISITRKTKAWAFPVPPLRIQPMTSSINTSPMTLQIQATVSIKQMTFKPLSSLLMMIPHSAERPLVTMRSMPTTALRSGDRTSLHPKDFVAHSPKTFCHHRYIRKSLVSRDQRLLFPASSSSTSKAN